MLVDAILGVNPSQDRANSLPESRHRLYLYWPNHRPAGNAQRCGDRQDARGRWRRGFTLEDVFTEQSPRFDFPFLLRWFHHQRILSGVGTTTDPSPPEAPSPPTGKALHCPHDSMPPVCGPGEGGGTGSPAKGDIFGPFSGCCLVSRRGWFMGHSQGGATGKLVICWVARARGAPMALRRPELSRNRLQRAQGG